jgi:hypothetical protein
VQYVVAVLLIMLTAQPLISKGQFIGGIQVLLCCFYVAFMSFRVGNFYMNWVKRLLDKCDPRASLGLWLFN